MAAGARRGRRAQPPGTGTTREAILDAARDSFLTRGFADTTIRAIAGTAGVDPALISYYFGTKRDLFAAVMSVQVRSGEEIESMLREDLEGAGRRLAHAAFTTWDQSSRGAVFRATLQWVIADDGAPDTIRGHTAEQIARPIINALSAAGTPEPDARERALLAGSQLVGVAMTRYILEVEPLASASVDHLADVVGPTLQHCLTGPLPTRRHPGAGQEAPATDTMGQ